MDLIVTSGALATLLGEAERAGDEECCGLLLGEGVRIAHAVPAPNVAADRLSRFEIDPAVLFAAHKAARSGGPQVLGYYHSHPRGPAAPSLEDRARASGDGRVWAIVAGGAVSCWGDAAASFEPLSYNVVDA